MIRTSIMAALLGATVAAPALADDVETIKSIDVETSLTDLNNPQAAAYWKSLDQDLEAAIAAQLVGRLGETGMDIKIDMNEVELANFFQEQIGAADNQMSGTVNVIDMEDNSNFQTFDLTVKLNQVMPLLPEGSDVTVITPTSHEVYTALVATFARAVVDNIEA
ncbi:hypothetical protein DSD19_13450 [Rhodovulum sp. BSW8]|uniref:Uncharacterized protein n=1 Tax=Rhodovulum visakhapatnamense TaxID=364297 RepID=A0A4R8FH66_9RHOB|nr:MULTISPECIES: hypothetical protein [Rhodovulum]OLS46422.1 hypothetical protein BV509_20090 [Rhodovulum sulfidophilum]MBL3571152.1 hypothetical protein [Rhodovulum visakhapatnamense]MBL3577587.1 hypothetical protein [Rhodovulum visakhapatnamense]RBO52592.1 hypothetical protein DSD19_13450 [Rhodovulum sp. BSW8]TDX25380.1 hypothetical protein EV657_12015 [Rhodovulum visakhapatnamense]